MTDAGTASAPQVAREVVWVAVDDEVVVLDPVGRAHVIGSTGALLWPLLDGVTSADELAADVADVFAIDVDAAVEDVRRFVDQMVGLGLVVATPPHEDQESAGGRTEAPAPDRGAVGAPSSPMGPPDPEWVGAITLGVGDQPVRVHADSLQVLNVLREVFTPWVVADGDATAGFGISVDRRGGAGPRLIPQLLYENRSLLRSRSLPRLLRRLDLALALLDNQQNGTEVRETAAFVRGDGAALVPVSVAEGSTAVERAVAAGGATIAEQAAVRLDLASGEIVVLPGLTRPDLDLAPQLVDEVRTAPGRYALRTIYWSEDQVVENERRATAVARLAELIDVPSATDRQDALDQVGALSDRVNPTPVSRWRPDVLEVLATIHVR